MRRFLSPILSVISLTIALLSAYFVYDTKRLLDTATDLTARLYMSRYINEVDNLDRTTKANIIFCIQNMDTAADAETCIPQHVLHFWDN